MKKNSFLTPSFFASIASTTCLIHCLVAPLFIVIAPFFGQLFHAAWVEFLFLFVSIGCGCYLIYKGYCKHKKRQAVVLFSIGALFWVGHALLSHDNIFGAELLLFSGTATVFYAYYLNHRQTKSCSGCCSTLDT